MSTAKLRFATQLEIIRSEEKDRYMISLLSQRIDELYTKAFGLAHFHIYQPYLLRISQFLYYLTTTLSGRQTIGEEYVCLIQYDPNTKQIPSLSRRLIMILLRIFGDLFAKHFLSSAIIQPFARDFFHPQLSPKTLEMIVRFLLIFVERSHKMLFYLTGNYYHLGKTFTRIRYLIYTRSTPESVSVQSTLDRTMKFLTLGLLIQHIIESYASLKQIALSITQHRQQLESVEPQIISSTSDDTSEEHVRCPLCYELAISNVALVPECGHVFCWPCIHTWIVDNQTCPLCKTSTLQSRIVHLINF